MGHLLTENRNGMIVEAPVTEAANRQEWKAGETMVAAQGIRQRMILGADKGYDTAAFVDACRGLKVTPHVTSKRFAAESTNALPERSVTASAKPNARFAG